MGDTQRLSPDEQIRFAFAAYESGRDFTVAVEEEFAILDAETLELTNRFEDLQAAAQGGPLAEHLVGELIASEVEVRTGRCEQFPDAAARLVERRSRRVRRLGRLRAIRPLPLRHGLNRRAHADVVERAAASCVSDRGDAYLRCAARPRRGTVARRADLLADGSTRARARRARANR